METTVKILTFILILVSNGFGQQCNLDQNCWKMKVGCKMVNAFPFERQTPVSCEQCSKACAARLNGPAPYCCQSAVYDSVHQSCDLFAVKSDQYRNRLTSCPTAVYFEPTRNPQCAYGNGGGSSTNAPPQTTIGQMTTPAPDCPAGQSPVLVTFKNSQSSMINGGTTFPASSQNECLQFCQKNQDNKGNVAVCKTAQFSSGQCTVSSTAPLPNSPATLQSAEGVFYYEKQCMPSNLAQNCNSILMDPKHLLIGFNTKTIDSPSYADCLQNCLNAQTSFGFKCASGMFYSDTTTGNCILNVESATTQPDKYIANLDPVTYFEPKCSGSGIMLKTRAMMKKQQDDVLPPDGTPTAADNGMGKWTLWTECGPGKSERARYRNCLIPRITKCPNETQPCPVFVFIS